MNKENIISFLDDNGLTEIEEIKHNKEGLLLKFDFDFDKEEIDAAKAYADDESEETEENDTWYDNFFIPYLNELAIDTVGEIIEDLMDELEVEAQFISYEISKEDYNYNEFVAVFYERGKEIDLGEILDSLEL
ncbi:hypothetical protein [Clostridium sp. DJ247]|uniref:hypothetical protein n=1 Tax=Clostridium sp. DJ247 TaxID=2726188 RepID=UPI0016259E48|nr:hypothetical protein [Clostridium sp. DJ247]MBC2581907.1 hypothetical protein [Clostridium sp. DJ247]